MENEDTPCKSEGNWLALTGILIICIAFYAISLLAAYHFNGTFNPSEWGPKTNYYMVIISALFLSVLLWYWDEIGFYRFPGVIFNSIDFDLYTPNMRWLDVFISHYSNVATVGLFFAVSIYSLRDSTFLSQNGIGRIMAAICVVGFVVYSLLLLRLAKRFLSLKSLPAYVGVCLVALLLDTAALGMIIKGVPAA